MENLCEKIALKLDPKSPGLIFPLSGIIHPDALAAFNISRRYFYAAVLDPEAAFFMSRLLVKTPINFKIFTHLSRTLNSRHSNILKNVGMFFRNRYSTIKHCGRISLPLSYNIQTMMHAVNQINVPCPWIPEHNFGTRSSATRGLRGAILRTNIRFNFCYNTGDFTLPHLTY